MASGVKDNRPNYGKTFVKIARSVISDEQPSVTAIAGGTGDLVVRDDHEVDRVKQIDERPINVVTWPE